MSAAPDARGSGAKSTYPGPCIHSRMSLRCAVPGSQLRALAVSGIYQVRKYEYALCSCV